MEAISATVSWLVDRLELPTKATAVEPISPAVSGLVDRLELAAMDINAAVFSGRVHRFRRWALGRGGGSGR